MPPRKDSLGALKRVSSDTADLFEGLSRASDRASSKKSEALVGALGGGFGLGAGFALSLAVHAAPFFIGGPLGAVIGIPLGILIWRGPGRFRQERRLEGNRMVLDELEARAKGLPKDAPPEVKAAIWGRYRAELGDLSMSPQPPGPEAPTAPLALPPPSEPPLLLPAPKIRDQEPAKPRSPRKPRTPKALGEQGNEL